MDNKEKRDEWKLQEGNLLIETDDSVDPEKAMYVCIMTYEASTHIQTRHRHKYVDTNSNLENRST